MEKHFVFLSTRSLSCSLPATGRWFTDAVTDKQFWMPACLLIPILMSSSAVLDALFRPGLLELSSSKWDTVTQRNSWRTLYVL